MSVQSSLAQYQQVSNQEAISGASPHRLVQMLMEGALQRMAEAKGAIKHGDIVKKGESIGKAISIIGGLRDSLNMDIEGGLSHNLDNLYEYMVECLLTANLHNNDAKINEVVELMSTIKSGWDGIADQVG